MRPAAVLLSCIFLPLAHADYKPVEVASPGTLSGVVTYSGKPVKPKTVIVSKDRETCGHEPRQVPRVDAGPEGGLAQAVVTLEEIEEGKAFPEGADSAAIDQHHCGFRPPVQIVPLGGKIKVRNSDPILHNIQAVQGTTTLFNHVQPVQGLEFEETLKEAGPIRLSCNAHSWMAGFVWVSEHPYAVLTAEDGKFELTDVPPGEYFLTVWHPYLGELSEKVAVAAGETLEKNFEFVKRVRSKR